MASNKQSAEYKECVVATYPPKVLQLKEPGGCKYAHPKYYTSLYDEQGKLLDDGDRREVESSYWEQFVEPKLAKELKNRLSLVESPRYVPGSIDFNSMEVHDGQEDEG